MEALPIPNQEAVTVAVQLVDEVFLRYSIPEQLHSDQGAQFKSQLISEVCKLLHIHKTRTTPYHPQCDGLVERFNRTLLDMLATCTGDHPFDWEQHIRKVCMAYNSSVHASTGYTPFYLMFGRQARLPLDVMYGTPGPIVQSPSEHASALKQQMTAAFTLVRRHQIAKHKRQKDFYDQKVHGKPYEPGSVVWLHSPFVGRGKSRKLHHPWSGPYKVVKKLSEATYRIQKMLGRKQRKVVHFDRLKPCSKTIRLDANHLSPTDSSATADTPSNPNPHPQGHTIGERLELVEDEDCEQLDTVPPSSTGSTATCRYPSRVRRPPSRYSDFVPHS